MLGLVAGVVLAPPAAALANFAIEPGKVFVDNMYPGGIAEFPITVYNTSDYEATYVVKVRAPDYTDTGYEPLPYLDWVTVDPGELTIKANGQANIKVTIAMPKDAVYPSKKAEVWVSFMEQAQGVTGGGLIQIELAARLLLSTTDELPSSGGTATVEGGGSVGIKAEAGGAESAPSKGVSPWVIIGSIVGLVVGGGVAYYLTKRRQSA